MLLALILFFPVHSHASETLSIAVVNVDKLLSESKAGKSIQKQHAQRREVFQKEFSKLEEKLITAEKELVKDKGNSEPEAFNKKRQDFEKEFMQTRQLFQKRRSSLEKSLNEAFVTLRKTIIQTTAEIADEKKYNLVLTRESVVIVEKTIDITEQVLERMDRNVTSIPLGVE